jgi:hypothetical protein
MHAVSPLARRPVLLGGLATLLVASCTNTPPERELRPVSFAQKGALRVAASRLDIVTTYVPPMRAPHIDHRVPHPPLEALQRWARERLAVDGQAGHALRFTVTEAAMTETDLPRSGGLRGAMTTQQDKRYDLALAAALELRESASGLVVASGEARAARFRTVAEDIPIAERERTWHALLEQTLGDLDAELERQMRAHFAPFLR